MTAAGAPPEAALPTPGLARRLMCMTYEAMLLFGVLMMAAYLYSSLTQQRHALQGTAGLQAFLFVVLGIYFGWFWSRSGQTLAMKAWHIRLVTAAGQPVSQARALLRYLLAWLWVLPALGSLQWAGLKGGLATAAALAAGVGGYAALAWLRPDRQFFHDVLCGTRLVTWRPAQ